MTGFLTMMGGVILTLGGVIFMIGGAILTSGAGFVGGKDEQEVRTTAPRSPMRDRCKVLIK
jgi:hypothetical protein